MFVLYTLNALYLKVLSFKSLCLFVGKKCSLVCKGFWFSVAALYFFYFGYLYVHCVVEFFGSYSSLALLNMYSIDLNFYSVVVNAAVLGSFSPRTTAINL